MDNHKPLSKAETEKLHRDCNAHFNWRFNKPTDNCSERSAAVEDERDFWGARPGINIPLTDTYYDQFGPRIERDKKLTPDNIRKYFPKASSVEDLKQSEVEFVLTHELPTAADKKIYQNLDEAGISKPKQNSGPDWNPWYPAPSKTLSEQDKNNIYDFISKKQELGGQQIRGAYQFCCWQQVNLRFSDYQT